MTAATLTARQEAFCLRYLETGNASEAYRQTYKSTVMKPETVNRKAKELLDNGKITARLDELRAPVVEKAQLTLESHLTELDRLKTAAEGAGNITAAIRAEELRGKAAGLYMAKVEVTTGSTFLGAVVCEQKALEAKERLEQLRLERTALMQREEE